jgi:putative peptidoglycan lipid II flippase
MTFGKSALIHSFSTLTSKITGIVRDIFLAGFIGTGALSDIFFIALKLPLSFKRSISDETFNSAYIPLFGKFEDLSDKKKQYQFARKILILTSLIIIPIVIVAEIFMPNVIKTFAPGITDENDFVVLVKISRIIFPYLFIIVISSVFVGTLNAKYKFALGAGLPIILNFAIILSILFSTISGVTNIVFLSWSVIIGGLIQSMFLFLSVDKTFWKVFFSLKRNYFSAKEFFKLIWPTFLSSTFLQLNMVLAFVILASYETGTVSYLYYAERIYLLPLSLIAIAISTVLIPNLSRALRASNKALALNTQSQATRYCILTVLPITFCLIVLSTEIVQVLFQRGEFTYESSLKTSLALKLFLIGLPFATLSKILTPYFFAIEKPKIPLKVSFYTVTINIILIVTLFQYLGYIAIPIGFSLSTFLNLILILIEHKKQNFFIIEAEIGKYIFKYVVLSIILATILLIINFFQVTSHILFLDLFLKIFLVAIIWICSIYFFDKEILSFKSE